MTWTADSSPETLTESGAGAGAYMASGVSLGARETIHFHFERTDATPADAWAVEIYASLDGSSWGEVPVASRRWEYGDVEGDVVITGPKYVRARILNADATPVDVVSVDVTYSLDGVSL